MSARIRFLVPLSACLHGIFARLSRARREELTAYLFISPWVFGFVVFTAGPILASLLISFFDTDIITGTYEWLGLGNYTTLFSRDVTLSLFWTALYNTIYYVVLSIPLIMVLGFVWALLLNQNAGGQSIYRTIYYLPSVLPSISVAILWLWLFNPEFGLINYLLSLVGIQGPSWLLDTHTAKPALVIMSAWGAGSNMLVFLAGLQGIPTQLYEAASIDGAGSLRRLFSITLPVVSPTLFFVLITNVIWTFQVFTNSYVMTHGGPANSTLMYVLYLYLLAFNQFRMGYASALAWVFFVIIMAFTVLLFVSSRGWVYYEAEIGGRR